MDDDLTQEDIARRYKAAIGSVTMLDAVAADPDAFANDKTIVQRNVEHLKLVVEWDFWTDEDMTPFENAIAANA